MKKIILLFGLFIMIASCNTIQVASDFDKNATFDKYKTFAFYKPSIDKAPISDLDKKRILRAIENTLIAKGFAKSETPDILIGMNVKEREQVTVTQPYVGFGWGWGFGWNPYFGGTTWLSNRTEGILYIDLIDAQKKELIWQGKGTGYLTENTSKKDEQAQEFVSKILAQYPPQQ